MINPTRIHSGPLLTAPTPRDQDPFIEALPWALSGPFLEEEPHLTLFAELRQVSRIGIELGNWSDMRHLAGIALTGSTI
ncbi:hypothetical protein Pdw03_3644 [Penicillium digitatum]|uniref:Uncharacterized protein n=1 Tax=Penicillium digitatum TaxID=36651 RepID=A0A7T7BIA0_PENDI|nr:hypothetical protein Pdw03_3644 [Penicillium digitatum]